MNCEPRDLSGQPGHQKLREFWQSQPRRSEGDDYPAPVAPPAPARTRRHKTKKRSGKRGNTPKLTDETVMDLYSRYVAGERVADLAVSVGVNRGTLDRYFRQRGFSRNVRTPRPRVYKQRASQPHISRVTDEQLSAAIDANNRGVAWKQIAADFGVDQKTLRNYRKRAGYGVGESYEGFKRKISDEIVTQVIDLRAGGMTWRDVCARVGFSRRGLQDCIKKYEELKRDETRD